MDILKIFLFFKNGGNKLQHFRSVLNFPLISGSLSMFTEAVMRIIQIFYPLTDYTTSFPIVGGSFHREIPDKSRPSEEWEARQQLVYITCHLLYSLERYLRLNTCPGGTGCRGKLVSFTLLIQISYSYMILLMS